MQRKLSRLLTFLAILSCVLLLDRISFTQSPKQERIAGTIADSSPVWLAGNVRPMFQAQNDQGPVEDSLKLENITLMFKLAGDQQANLAALLDEQLDRSSPLYHHWLTPEQFADSFGMSRSDVAKVAAWLQSQGFTVTQTARSRMWMSFTGTAAQVRSALYTEIHYFSSNGKTYYGNATEPAVPAVLADVVLGFHALDNYGLKPRSVFRQVAQGPRSGPAALQDRGLQPEFTSQYSGSNYLSPGDFATIYHLNDLYNSGIDGTGQSIAVVGQTDLYNNGSDITTFRTLSNLPTVNLTQKLIPGVSDPGVTTADINEASLDVEWSGAVARNATIIYVNGGKNGVMNAFQYAIDNNLAPVITISYGNCEANWGVSGVQGLSQLGQLANSQGITIMAAAGDAGAADCDNSTSTTTVTSATHGLVVDAPASVPYVTGVGGTEFNEGAGAYWQTTTTALGDLINSALSYIPEKAWNDTAATSGLVAGGGGASSFILKPTWQTGPGVPNDGFRDVPDLSMNASVQHDGYLVCASGKCIYGFRDNSMPTGFLTAAGGTSAGAPTFAGIVALINQKMGSSQGNINPTLYAMAATSPAAFHDITTGSNIVPCTSGSTGCSSSSSYQIGYSAGAGYDQATGLGSVDAYNLVMAWGSSGAGNLPAPTLIGPANGATGVALTPTFSWSAVAGNAGYRIMIATTPGALTTNPASACAACVIINSTSYTPTSSLTENTLYYWQVQALEPSSSTGSAAWSGVFVFNTGNPDFSLGVSPNTLTISPGGGGTSTVTITPINNLNVENVTLSCSVSSTLAGVTCTPGAINGFGSATITIAASSTAGNYPAPPGNHPSGPLWLAALAAACLALMGFWNVARPSWPRMAGKRGRGELKSPPWNSVLRPVLPAGALACLLAASLSCGGGSSSSGGGGTTRTPTAESGTVTITGVGPNSQQHTAQISVNVT